MMEEVMIFVIGSIEQAEDMERAFKKLCDLIPNANTIIKRSYENWTNLDIAKYRLDTINFCDIVYVVTKLDGTVDESTAYEIEYAKRMKKPIMYDSLLCR